MKIKHPTESIKNILYAPHVSEKATVLSQQNQYVFNVVKTASKKQVQIAVEKHYDVKVATVNLLNMRGKPKGMGRNKGRRNHWKKAYVTLVEGHTITSTSSE